MSLTIEFDKAAEEAILKCAEETTLNISTVAHQLVFLGETVYRNSKQDDLETTTDRAEYEDRQDGSPVLEGEEGFTPDQQLFDALLKMVDVVHVWAVTP